MKCLECSFDNAQTDICSNCNAALPGGATDVRERQMQRIQQYLDGLAGGSNSPLSPLERLEAARSQFHAEKSPQPFHRRHPGLCQVNGPGMKHRTDNPEKPLFIHSMGTPTSFGPSIRAPSGTSNHCPRNLTR